MSRSFVYHFRMLLNVINIKYNIISGYRLFSSYRPCYSLFLGLSGQCSTGGQVHTFSYFVRIDSLQFSRWKWLIYQLSRQQRSLIFAGLNMQAIVDAAILTTKVGKKRHLKEVKSLFFTKLFIVQIQASIHLIHQL